MGETVALGYVLDENGTPLSFADFVDMLVKPLPRDQDLNHMALGVGGETGELIDAIKRHTIYEKPIDRDNVIEEIGDMFFYVQRMMRVLDITLEEVLQGNYNKLNKRYHEKKFSTEQAQQRADKAAE